MAQSGPAVPATPSDRIDFIVEFMRRGVWTHELRSRFAKEWGVSWQVMAEALRQHGATQTVTEASESRHGKKFTVECQIQTPDGKNPCILTGWIQEGTKPPRLVTAHPNS